MKELEYQTIGKRVLERIESLNKLISQIESDIKFYTSNERFESVERENKILKELYYDKKLLETLLKD